MRSGCSHLAAIAALVTTLICSHLAAARQSNGRFRLDTTAGWGGAVNGFERVGNYGFCGSGQRFVVLDMSDEANVHEIACLHMQGTVEAITVSGNYAYVGMMDEYPISLATINITNPAAPVMTWAERPPSTQARHVVKTVIYGNSMYLIRSDNALGSGVAWFSLTDPSHPVFTSWIVFRDETNGFVHPNDMVIRNNLA